MMCVPSSSVASLSLKHGRSKKRPLITTSPWIRYGPCNLVERVDDGVVCHFKKQLQKIHQTAGQIGGALTDRDRLAATISASPIKFTSIEELSVTYEANELRSFDLSGRLKMHVAEHVDGNFQIKIDRADTPGLKFKLHNSIQEGIFRKQNIIRHKAPGSPFRSRNTKLMNWGLHLKEESNVPLKSTA